MRASEQKTVQKVSDYPRRTGWGSGCSPSLTKDLVMFTDNQNPVNLLALDMKTGEVVASLPVIDELPEGTQVSVENSAIVYDDGAGTVSTIVCNWFGAGSAKLAEADSDSSVQSYEKYLRCELAETGKQNDYAGRGARRYGKNRGWI